MNPLGRIRIFEGLPEEVLDRLAQAALLFEALHEQELFAQDDPADAVYAIVGGEGSVRMGAIDRRSKRLMVEVFKAGDLFGEIGVIDGGPRTTSATVEGRVRLMRIGGATFLATLRDAPGLGAKLAEMLAHRLRRTFDLFKDATFETVDVRLARQILYLVSLGSRKTEAGIVLASRLRQPDLADLLGATTRSIITVLNEWRATGIVQYDTTRAQLTIRNEAALRALFEG